jgi:predicted ATPase
MYAQCRGDVDLVKRCGDTVDYMSNEHGLVQWRQFSEMVLGWASVAQGDDSDITRFQQGFDTYVDSGALIYAPVLLTTLASQLLQFDRVDEAHKTVASARQIVDKMGERLIEPELLRVEGEIYWRNADIANARACFERGIEMARKQNARSWELRASMSLAALLNEQGEKQQGLELLQNIYGWFSEGFESSDLKKAQSLLELLSSHR